MPLSSKHTLYIEVNGMRVSVETIQGSVVVKSTEIAARFGKRHDNVIRDIESIIKKAQSSKLRDDLFYETSFVNSRNRRYPEFLMTRDGFALLAMGFTGEKALEWKLKYIEAFNTMENALASQGREGMRALSEAVAAFESDKEKASQYGKALAGWRKIKDNHIEAIVDATKKAQMLLDFKS